MNESIFCFVFAADTFLTSWNELAELLASGSQCLCSFAHVSINIVSVFLTIVIALKTFDLLAIYLFTRRRAIPSVPSDSMVQQQKHLDCSDHDGRCLAADGTRCIDGGLGIQLLSDLHKTTGTVQKPLGVSWQTEAALLPPLSTVQFSETDV